MQRNGRVAAYHAKSFYNAYIALERLGASDDDYLLLVPTIVYGVLSIELSLKAILVNSGVTYVKVHYLLELFTKLPDEYRDELLFYLAQKAPEFEDPDLFMRELAVASEAFAKWRNVYEVAAPAVSTRFISALANAAITTVLSHWNVNMVPLDGPVDVEAVEEKYERNREQFQRASFDKLRKALRDS